MRRVFTGAVLVAALLAATGGSGASSAGLNGRIAFDRTDPQSPDDTFVYTANPDGSRVRLLLRRHTCCPSWSHDGRRLTLPAALPGDTLTTAIVGGDGRGYKLLRVKDATLNVACAGGVWSRDDRRLACESWDNSRPVRNGIYTISSADGGALKRLTSNPRGDDLPGSYSRDGKRLVFARFDEDRNIVGLFVIGADGSRRHRITPPGTVMQGGNTGDWSPTGNDIVFSRKASPAAPGSIWLIRADGTQLRQVEVKGLNCGGDVGCHGPRWSPDGKKLVFAANTSTRTDIYVVNADGSGLVQVTKDGHSDDPSWGTQPQAP